MTAGKKPHAGRIIEHGTDLSRDVKTHCRQALTFIIHPTMIIRRERDSCSGWLCPNQPPARSCLRRRLLPFSTSSPQDEFLSEFLGGAASTRHTDLSHARD